MAERIPETAGMTSAVVKGSIWNFAAQILTLGISFVSIPFVIRLLGSEGYGVLVLVMLVPTYFAFADIGMGVASTKFASEEYGRGNKHKEGSVVRTAALIALVGTATVAVPVILLAPAILSGLNVPEQWLVGASYALRIIAVAYILGALATVVNSPMLARLRVDLNALTAAVPRCLYSSGAPVVLLLGFGLPGVATWFLVVTLLGLAIVAVVSARLLPELLHSKVDRPLFAPLLRFGTGWLFAVMAAMFLVNVEKLLLARMVSVQTLAYYSIAFMVANTALLFPQAMTQSLLPAFSRLRPEKGGDELQALFRRSIRLNLLVEIPALAVMAVGARPLFRLWAGPEFEVNSPLPFYILLVGLFFNILASSPHSLILSTGRTERLARLYWIQLLIYPFIAAVLIYYAGITGAAAAWSLRAIADSVLIHVLSRRVSTVRTEYRRLLIRTVFLGLLFVPGVAVAMFDDNYTAWLMLIVPISLLAYCSAVWATALDAVEKDWARNRLAVAGRPGRD